MRCGDWNGAQYSRCGHIQFRVLPMRLLYSLIWFFGFIHIYLPKHFPCNIRNSYHSQEFKLTVCTEFHHLLVLPLEGRATINRAGVPRLMYTSCYQSLQKWLVKKPSFTKARNVSSRRKLIVLQQLSQRSRKKGYRDGELQKSHRVFCGILCWFGKKCRFFRFFIIIIIIFYNEVCAAIFE